MPDRRAREERRRALERLGLDYGYPAKRKASRRRVRAIGLVFVLVAVVLVLVGPLPIPTWDQYPAWWAPMVALAAGVAFLLVSEADL